MQRVYDRDLYKKSGQIAGKQLPRAEQAWRQFCLIPLRLLETPSGEVHGEAFRSVSAFLMYHWGAGDAAGLSLGNALCGRYNSGFTLLRSFLELVLNGSLFQCLARKKCRERAIEVLDPLDPLRMLVTHLQSILKDTDEDITTELQEN